jgi:methionyl-tRNA formyltransferase
MPLRTVFMGTPEIAVPALRRLAERTTVSLVITQPDRPSGRGLAPSPPPVKQAAIELGLPVWQPESMRGAEADPRLANHDLFVVMAYGEILRQPVLSLPRACINLHASALPRWRGASPLQACLRAGDAETAVCVMEMVPALDAGPVYVSERITLHPHTTLAQLHDQVASVAADALDRFLGQWPGIPAVPQDPALVTLCRKLTTADGRLNWARSAEELERWVRAYTPAPGCWSPLGDDRLRILQVAALPDRGLQPAAVRIEDQRILVGCAGGTVELLRLQAPGRKAMGAADFLRGNRLPESLA